MQKNLYFQSTLRRQNLLKTFFLDGFLALASYPRLLLECFIRRNFGQRYFSWATVITVAIIVALLPIISNGISSLASNGYKGRGSGSFWTSYATWYLFLIAFLYFAWRRSREVKLNSSIFDFSRFSLYSGNLHPFFRKLKINGRVQNVRTIETLLEPAAFLIVGIVLILLGQTLGILLVVSALAYSFSYSAAYRNGDNFIMDKIDQIIMNEELTNAFVEDMDGDKTRGVRFHMEKPKSKILRKKLVSSFLENDPSDSTESVTIAH